jgi:homoserine acetyltransferase
VRGEHLTVNPLQSGFTLRGAKLAYKTYGTLNADKTNVVAYPTWYSGWHTDMSSSPSLSR